MIGFPKVDCLVDGSISRQQVLRELGVPEDRPIVLFAPSRSEYSSLYSQGHAIIEALAALDVTLIVKIHDFYYNPSQNEVNWPAELMRYAERENVRIDRRPNISPLLFVADLLVSDISSVANEYLLMNRPIIFMDAPDKFIDIADRVDMETWGRKTGTVLKSASELTQWVPRLLSQGDGLEAIRTAAAADFFYQPGTAALRTAQTIQKYLEDGLLD
jgi:CDP-glycerol glycerophosphotransferase (TagB/SpsB family)